ncbi:hypothetical protein [Agrobacterium deltaense]|uniref:hypothetical protein n=1 Tax=Agrobacterium TaxID=357 RepID=UPI00201DCC65|nr:hypothetical protein [Agrobacterium deltaense]
MQRERLEKVTSSVTPKLDSCGAEPIHIPGSIQEHGALLVLSARELSVAQFLSIRFLPGKLVLFGRRPGRAKRAAPPGGRVRRSVCEG